MIGWLALALLSRRYRPNAVDAPWRWTSARIACTPLPRNTASRPRRLPTADRPRPRPPIIPGSVVVVVLQR
ncbi:MAG: hypothetical protein AUH41_00405 [Gemmatimonadetes bacterium 13_1_40CM_66_11]|nr:MAG: hypothetical protein AUH41_00405 [Gemmatimonadetes bacterium 13_1_40CM_66_11]